MREGHKAQHLERNLGTLIDPKLDASEQAILSWTRSTVRHETQHIQRSTQPRTRTVSNEQRIEVIGVACLARCFVRLAAIGS